MTLLDAGVTKPQLGGASYSLRHRAERVLWAVIWWGAASWTPVPFHRWRRAILRLFGAQIARTAKVYPGVRVWYPKNLHMEEYSCLGPGVDCYCMDLVSLGARSLVSQKAVLCCGTHDIDDPYFQLKVKPIRIEADAWVAAEAFVGPGVTVGEGAVLGARGVTFRNMSPWTVYVGNPAVAIRSRGQ